MGQLKLRNSPLSALVDDEMMDCLDKYLWAIETTGYVRANMNGKRVSLHRFILRPTSRAEHVDHINGDKLDNRKSNLRLCTQTENNWNTGPRKGSATGFKGVHKTKYGFAAQIREKGKKHQLGTFKSPEEAAQAYDKAAIRFHGEFANLNFKIEG